MVVVERWAAGCAACFAFLVRGMLFAAGAALRT